MEERIGLYIGRFQPFHKGHKSVVREALTKCDRLVIAVGSATESRTKKNPFSYCERIEIIRRSLRGMAEKVIFVPVPDRLLYGDDPSWGEYVLNCVEEYCGLRPVVNFEGKEACRSTWFEGIDIERVVIDREIMPCSATEVRKALIEDDIDAFYTRMATGIWIKYDILRKIILEVENG